MLEEIKKKLEDEIERLMKELTVTLPKAIQKAVELGDPAGHSEGPGTVGAFAVEAGCAVTPRSATR